jgi:hypothetical protein
MHHHHRGARFLRIGLLCLALAVAGCGGGGGTASPSANGSFSVAFSPPAISVETIAGYAQQINYSATLTYTGKANLYLAGDADPSVVAAVTGNAVGNSLSGVISLRGDLAPGTHTTSYLVHACLDQQCATEVSGSPATLPITFVVAPNIQVQQQVSLERTGQDPAPGIDLPVTVPAAAGTVAMTSTGPTNAVGATFDGATLHITTTQVRAGVYVLTITLQGSNDPRYVKTVTVTYTVNPPPGGEQALSVAPGYVNLYLPQGTSTTRPLVVTPPTWTNSWDPPQLVDTSGIPGFLSLTNAGNFNYALAINGASVPAGTYSASVVFSAGATGGTVSVPVTVNVTGVFYPTGVYGITINANSTTADLHMPGQVLTVDGVAAQWTATTGTPWLQLAPTTGVTGVDSLDVAIDPTFAGANDWLESGSFNLAVNRPGTLPLSVPVSVYNYLPQVERSVAVLSGTGGRIYVDGAISSVNSALLPSGGLSVTGATLAAASYRTDTRFLGDVSLLALDLTGATPGQAITISVNTPLASSHVTVAVKAPEQVSPGYLVLPYGAYRPSRYAPGLDAFYFSAPDTVYRWAQAGSTWTLAQAAIPGVTGVALRQDEQQLYAADGGTLLGLDPIGLTQIGTGQLLDFNKQPSLQFDGTGPAALATFAYASDGRAIASLASLVGGQPSSRGASWVTSWAPTRTLVDLTYAPTIGDPGVSLWSGSPVQPGVGLVASPSGHTVVGTDAAGYTGVYQASLAYWNSGPPVPAGVTIVGVSDSGQRMVRSDGTVLDTGNAVGNLANVLPLTDLPGGYSLTQDGRYGLVYAYQIATVNGNPRAGNATLRVVDTSQAPTTPLTSADVVATINLSDAVGCTAPTLAAGETCQHTASITLAPGSDSAFILGPRGIAAVPLPANVAVPTAAVAIRPGVVAESRAPQVAGPLLRPLGTLRPGTP